MPHYLRRGGEGPNFYYSLPSPWDCIPEDDPVPVSNVPGLQKTGYFPEFSGKIAEYPNFRASIITASHGVDMQLSAKYLVLIGCLKGVSEMQGVILTGDEVNKEVVVGKFRGDLVRMLEDDNKL